MLWCDPQVYTRARSSQESSATSCLATVCSGTRSTWPPGWSPVENVRATNMGLGAKEQGRIQYFLQKALTPKKREEEAPTYYSAKFLLKTP